MNTFSLIFEVTDWELGLLPGPNITFNTVGFQIGLMGTNVYIQTIKLETLEGTMTLNPVNNTLTNTTG